jgi:hypothetical protein
MSRGLALVLAAAVAIHGACVQSTHRISRGELGRLAMLPPAERGEQVRVVQEIVGEAPPAATPVTAETRVEILWVPEIRVSVGGGSRRPGAPHGVRPAGGGGGKSGPGTGLGAIKADEAWVLFVIAATAVVVLAATEGARYDGWVRLHPMHPVHLWGPGGYTVMPLAHVDPQTAAWARRAVVRPAEGPWQALGRAPLDRQGWSYSVLLGAGTAGSADGAIAPGTSARVQLGYFPSHELGVQLDWGFTVRDNALGRTVFDNRLGAEATFAPVRVGPLHGGLFGGVAAAARFEDGVPAGRRRGLALSGGALLQLELTTRLAISGRLGAARAYDEVTHDILVGLSVY